MPRRQGTISHDNLENHRARDHRAPARRRRRAGPAREPLAGDPRDRRIPAGRIRTAQLNVRDTEIHRLDGAPGCTPYTRTPIAYVGRGDGLDRKHIVTLAEAWESRPPGFTRADLRAVAEDHANLTLADAGTNRSKSARDAAEWTPRYNGAWMAYRIIEVKRRHELSVDPVERNALERLLAAAGPNHLQRRTPPRRSAPEPAAATAEHPPVRRYRNCTMLRTTGWNRGVRRDGGSYRHGWDDAERRTYALNAARDRDSDGHACE